MNDAVSTLAVDDGGNLYCGGYFLTAGSNGSTHIAIWHGDHLVGLPGLSESQAGFAFHGGAPNPFIGSTTVWFDLPRAENVRLDVFDTSGRRVRTLLAASQPAGRHAVTWDGRDDRGLRQPAGVYHCRLQAGAFVAARGLSLVR